MPYAKQNYSAHSTSGPLHAKSMIPPSSRPKSKASNPFSPKAKNQPSTTNFGSSSHPIKRDSLEASPIRSSLPENESKLSNKNDLCESFKWKSVIIVVLLLILVVFQTLYMFFPHFMLRYFAVQPREFVSFFGLFFSEFLHFSWMDMLYDMVPFFVIALLTLTRGNNKFIFVSVVSVFIGNLILFIFGVSNFYIGLSTYCISLLANMYVSCIFELISPLQCNKHVYRFFSYFCYPPSVKAFLIAISATAFYLCIYFFHVVPSEVHSWIVPVAGAIAGIIAGLLSYVYTFVRLFHMSDHETGYFRLSKKNKEGTTTLKSFANVSSSVPLSSQDAAKAPPPPTKTTTTKPLITNSFDKKPNALQSFGEAVGGAIGGLFSFGRKEKPLPMGKSQQKSITAPLITTKSFEDLEQGPPAPQPPIQSHPRGRRGSNPFDDDYVEEETDSTIQTANPFDTVNEEPTKSMNPFDEDYHEDEPSESTTAGSKPKNSQLMSSNPFDEDYHEDEPGEPSATHSKQKNSQLMSSNPFDDNYVESSLPSQYTDVNDFFSDPSAPPTSQHPVESPVEQPKVNILQPNKMSPLVSSNPFETNSTF